MKRKLYSLWLLHVMAQWANLGGWVPHGEKETWDSGGGICLVGKGTGYEPNPNPE
jgi:hypothetical protein